MARTIRYFVVVSFLVSSLVSRGHSASGDAKGSRGKGDKQVLATLNRFRAAQAGAFRAYFDEIRPPRLAASMKFQVLASLPPEGEVRPSADDVSKLKYISSILAYHDRESVIEVKVIRVFQAAIAVYAKCVLLVSEEALRLLTAAELQALVAHELGHEYIWDEFEAARSAGDHQKIQQLELWCDGVATLTLLELGLDPRVLASAISKVNRFNKRFGTPDNVDDYATDAVRSEFHKSLAELYTNADKRGERRVE